MTDAELAALGEQILSGTRAGDAIELDAIGDAIGARAISAEQIDRLLGAIETAGRKVVSRQGGQGEANLKRVLTVARALRAELGRAPRAAEIAAGTDLSLLDVQHALSLARIMQR